MVQEKEGTGVLLDDSCIRKEETGALEKKESGLMYSIFFFFFFLPQEFLLEAPFLHS